MVRLEELEVVEHDAGQHLQVPRGQLHDADSGCVESGDQHGGNSGGLVEGFAGGPLLPHHDEKVEVQAGCGG